MSAGLSVIPLQLIDFSIFLVAKESLYLLFTVILIAIALTFNIHLRSIVNK